LQALAAQVGIALLFLPAYSRELYLIERPWKVAQRCALSRTRVDADPSY